MISVAKISTRGQVAIPKAIREKLSIGEGDTVLFEERDGEIYIRKVENFLDLEGSLPSTKFAAGEVIEERLSPFFRLSMNC